MDPYPLISVIVPVYNVEKYIHQCINSIINQTYKNLEIILVDDGSPDNCGKICDEYALRDSRVRVIHKSNEGTAYARNSGLELAMGEYIGFIDSDDWIEADMYEHMLDLLTSSKSDLCICGYYRAYENVNMVSKRFEKKSLDRKEAFKFMLSDGNPAAWNKLYKKETLDGVKYPNTKGEDLAVIFTILESTTKIVLTDMILCYYRQRESSLGNRYDVALEKVLDIYDNNIDLIKDIYPEFAILAKQKKLLYYQYLVDTYLKSREYLNLQKINLFIKVLRKNIGMIAKRNTIPLKAKLNIYLLCTNKTLYSLLKRFRYSKKSKKYIMFD